MRFAGTLFIFIALPALLVIYYLVPARLRAARNVLLFLTGCLFYAFISPAGLIILLIAAGLGHFFAAATEAAKRKKRPSAVRRICCLGIYAQVLLFLLFVYLPQLLIAVGAVREESALANTVAFPPGIAFYTLQIISILIEVARNGAHMEKKRFPLFLTVTFFPKVSAGPSVSYREFTKQLTARKESFSLFGEGAWRFLVGLSKKLLLAEPMGNIWTQIAQKDAANLSVLGAWTGFLALAFYLYFECSAYADMALGLGRMFGFSLPENFLYPYQAENLRDFFRRWQASATASLRRMVVFFIADSGGTETVRTLRLLAVGLIFGLWHGATANTLVFGVYLGIMLAADQLLLNGVLKRLPHMVKKTLTFLAAGIGWVLLMLPTPAKAGAYLLAMAGGGSGFADAYGAYVIRQSLLLLLVMAVGSTALGKNLKDKLLHESGKAGRALLLMAGVLLFAVTVAALVAEPVHSFLSFPL